MFVLQFMCFRKNPSNPLNVRREQSVLLSVACFSIQNLSRQRRSHKNPSVMKLYSYLNPRHSQRNFYFYFLVIGVLYPLHLDSSKQLANNFNNASYSFPKIFSRIHCIDRRETIPINIFRVTTSDGVTKVRI